MTVREHLEDRLYGTLLRYTSEPTARGILRRARQQNPFSTDAGAYFEMVMFGAKLFVDETRRDLLMAELSEICYGRRTANANEHYEIEINSEHSCRRARMLIRRLVRQAGGKDLLAVRAATALSELARNALMYAGGGRVEIDLSPSIGVLRVVVADEGPGIPNIEEILAGRYKSKTGLGRGLLGVKKLAERFTVHTTTAGTTGTKVEFEMAL